MEEKINITKRTADLCKKLILAELEKSNISGIYSKGFIKCLRFASKELEGINTATYTIEELLQQLKERM